MIVKAIEKQFREDFNVLNNYALELKGINPGSNVIVVSEKKNFAELPVF